MKYIQFKIISIVITMNLFLLVNCSSFNNKNPIILLKSSEIKPQWCQSLTNEDKENYYYSNLSKNTNNEIEGLKESINTLTKDIKNKLNVIVENHYENIPHKISGIEIFKAFQTNVIQLMDIDHIIPDDTYYEKIQFKQKIYFNCYTYKIIAKQSLKDKINETITLLRKQYTDKQKIQNVLSKIDVNVIK